MEPLDPVLARKLNKINEVYLKQEYKKEHRRRAIEAKKPLPGSIEEKILFYVADARSKNTLRFREDKADYKLTAYILSVIEDVCMATLDELRSINRDSGLTIARALFTYMERRLNNRSHPEIGAILNKDHTSCMHMINRIPDYQKVKIFQVYMKDPRMNILFESARLRKRLWEKAEA